MGYMIELLANYDALRGKRREHWKVPFWDAVVITAADTPQKLAFLQQIEEKKRSREMPIFDEIHVFADPHGPKIGSGGSTFLVLKELSALYGSSLFNMRILLIHAGGQSQRLPSHSCLGKLFALLPMGEPTYQMLDLKLAMYLPFLESMKPGIFLTASDDIISFDLKASDDWSFDGDGFTALAHPSSLDIAIGHGVYVLTPDLSSCTRVLQKPSLDLLKLSGAIVGTEECQKAYTDSAYFFDHSVTEKFLRLQKEMPSIGCEVDAYGDFLQPLGSESSAYFSGLKDSCTGELYEVRCRLYDLLKNSPLQVVVLQNSTFYHLGTFEEYVENLTANGDFATNLGIRKRNSSYPILGSEKISGILMHSCLHPNSELGQSVVMEYCDFDVPLRIESGIISNCQLLQSDSYRDQKLPIDLPRKMFFYTAAIGKENKVTYVTVAFHFDDDLKKTYESKNCSKLLKYLGKTLEDRFGELCSFIFDTGDTPCSLWNARLFRSCPTRHAAFVSTLRLVTESELVHPYTCLSMEQILRFKNVGAILSFQNDLRQKIFTRQTHDS